MWWSEVYQKMEEGKKVRRSGWNTAYLTLGSEEQFGENIILLHDIGYIGRYTLITEDNLADDWECVKRICGKMKYMLDIKLPSLKIDYTIPEGTIYIRNEISPLKTEITYGEIKDPMMKYKEWLQGEIRECDQLIKTYADKENYSMASYCTDRKKVFEFCLEKIE